MAEYLPLLERAVAGLADAAPEARRAIYERARTALLGQLRSMDPPVPDEAITRESAALDDAIVRLEAKLRAPDLANPTPAPLPIARSGRLGALPAPRSALISRPADRPSASNQGLSVSAPPQTPRENPPLAPRPSTIGPPRPAMPLQPSATSGAADSAMSALPPRPPRPARPLNTAPRIGLEPRGIGAVGAPVVKPPETAAPILPSAPTLVVPAVDGTPPSPPARVDSAAKEPGAALADALSTIVPPAAKERRSAGFYIAVAIGALLVVGVAVEAWRLRDRPEDITSAVQTTSADPAAKVAERVPTPGITAAEPSDASGDATIGASPATGSDTSAAGVPPDSSAAPQKAPAPLAATAPAPEGGTQTSPTPTDAPTRTGAQQTQTSLVGVTQRAALLVEAPEDPQKVRTYPGFVVWKAESVSTGQGQPLSGAIVADVDIPDAKLTMTMVMKKNTEPQFPASHTIEFRFKNGEGESVGPVKQINVPEMRLDDNSPTGDPLAGLPVPITDNYFLVGLSRGGAEAANVQMIETRNWIDVSLMLTSGKAAKITFEKGAPGQRIVEDTFKIWQ